MKLLKESKTYRCDNESEAENLIETNKNDMTAYSVEYANKPKEKKVKGEVVDSWFEVTVVKKF